ncbi:hypothetical protein BGY98DRAFT_1023576 [Russula aff. rugulosa BPL654]|nr:hypothetical protein BGY98DRAFT_1023576 [Russula aff. rugulosa BPL654]
MDRRTRQVSYFEDDDSIQGQKKSSVLLLRNVVKPEDVDNPISVSGNNLSASVNTPEGRSGRSEQFLQVYVCSLLHI